MRLGFKDMKKISFPDCNVLSFHIDFEINTLSIDIDGAWLETENNGKELGPGKMKFYSWKNFTQRKFNFSMNQWEISTKSNFDTLKDILEFEQIEQTVYLRGFGAKSGLWIECKIDSPFVEMDFDD